MKQILQNLSSGVTTIVDVPVPVLGRKQVMIRASKSLISIGTERMLVEFGRANLIDKARQQPEKVKMVLEKVGVDGVAATYDAVKSKLDQPIPLGYSHVGVVERCGADVTRFKVGDRVVSNGNHASVVVVPENLVAKIPDEVSDDSASFTVVSAIALQGIRLVNPALGECFVVIGLGVIGLITVQLLRANGCRVLGIDFDEEKLRLAESYGAETLSLAEGQDAVLAGMAFSRGAGVDGVIITASTKSNDPVTQAARMCRKRGRIVLVGVVGLELNRADFYEKELTFQVSCSYGPGRYDPTYEEQGHDYPLGFVRWTENRNFEAILDMMAASRVDVRSLITNRFDFTDAVEAYQLVSTDKSAIGIVLDYESEAGKVDLLERTVHIGKVRTTSSKAECVCGFIGAGNYASRVLMPAFSKAGAVMACVASQGGVSAAHHGKKHGFARVTSDAQSILTDDEINTVVIATRHNSHAEYVVKALEAGKHVFVEKPLALTLEDLQRIDTVYQAIPEASRPKLMVGFNRRFAPHVVTVKELLQPIKQPKAFIFTMNAGYIPSDSWVQDEAVGGGRIVGEACHHIDLMRFLAGSPIADVQAMFMGAHPLIETNTDKAVINLKFEDGSFGSIHYLANGGKVFPKERIEVFADDTVLQINNFLSLKKYAANKGFNKRSLRQDKGVTHCVKSFVESCRSGGESPITYEEILEVSEYSIKATEIA